MEVEQSLCSRPSVSLAVQQNRSIDDVDSELECSIQRCHDVQRRQTKRRETERYVCRC